MSAPIRKATARRMVATRLKPAVDAALVGGFDPVARAAEVAQKTPRRKTASTPAPKPRKPTKSFLAPSTTPIGAPVSAPTREDWLNRAVELLRPEFAANDAPLPEVRVSFGFPKGRKALAECWHSTHSADSAREIFIKPTNDVTNVVRLIGILTHELCHAALPDDVAHKKPFVELGKKMLLEGKARHMIDGEAFKAKWAESVATLGPFPAAGMVDPVNASTGARGPSTKKRKVRLECDVCHMTFRLASKWISDGLQCPDRDCTGHMQC